MDIYIYKLISLDKYAILECREGIIYSLCLKNMIAK